ncbi:MAG: alginate lyase family protein, partial [Bacteroidota bacterium]
SDATKMNPNLLYAQAINGRSTGRGIGIIDTIHLIEIARSIMILNEAGTIEPNEYSAIKEWFKEYLHWMVTHQYGRDEMNAKNNHGTCWVMQASIFAKLLDDEQTMEFCRHRFKEVLLPEQMAMDGSFPLELKRTKPYNYSLFNLDAMSAICQILSTEKDDLWQFTLPDGRSMKKGIEFMGPYIADKSSWKYPADVMFYEYYPVRQPSLLFAGIAFHESQYIDLWKHLNADPTNEEVIRNYPIRQPILWVK